MQHHSTKVTSHIPWQLDHDSNGPLETIPGANVIIVQKKWIKAAWNLTAEITVASDY